MTDTREPHIQPEIGQLLQNSGKPISRKRFVLAAAAGAALAFFSGLFKRLHIFQAAGGTFFTFQSEAAFHAGNLSEYTEGEVSARWSSKKNLWLIRDLDGLYALSTMTVRGERTDWDERLKLFKSVSSSSRYYKSGLPCQTKNNDSMKRLAVRIDEHGNITIDPKKTFHHSKGSWQQALALARIPEPLLRTPICAGTIPHQTIS